MSETFSGKVDVLNEPPPQGKVTIELNGQAGDIVLGGNGQQGTIALKNSNGKDMIRLGHIVSVSQKPGVSPSSQQPPPPPAGPGTMILNNETGQERITLKAVSADITAGGNGADGSVFLKDTSGNIRVWITTSGSDKNLRIRDGSERDVLIFNTGTAALYLGAAGNASEMVLLDDAGTQRIHLDSANGRIVLTNNSGANAIELTGKSREVTLRDLAGHDRIALMGLLGRILIKDSSGNDSIMLDSVDGDIKLLNADCAEEFDVLGNPEPGTVLMLGQPGVLQPSDAPYDTRVAGVVSGIKARRPGIILGRNLSRKDRLPVALCGTVYCKAEADTASIKPGALLTTSSLSGYAMAATDRDRAFGAVLGKALDGLERGRGMVPVLVALQ
jgi:hypothetical protein